uniref:DUF4283 domain-containing protein n=1 Tax=Ananas comosus var. bracteatus TaxID=296719 RepID=A0A6V7QCE0_ANACO|nr:unnamed protein product [Ananas comosus var. bracteatus]
MSAALHYISSASSNRQTEDQSKEKGKKICKEVIWADEIGKELVKVGGSFEGEKRDLPRVGGLGGEAETTSPSSRCPNPQDRLSPAEAEAALEPIPVKRCFRCLARDYVVVACWDPVRCRRCLCYGHRASLCRADRGPKASNHMYRPYHRPRRAPGRAPVSKVFVPYTEEYLRRRDLHQNAVLADVIRPANLGPDLINTIKNALARRFGGYTDDFAVARHRERDYAIFLPEWAPADVLTRREVLTLNDFWIRCYLWGQHSNARPHRSRYRAWIRLINLPFEIWTIPRVAAIVGGFGRFVKADATTRAMTDLRAYRCQVVMDSMLDVPQNQSIVLGDELFSVMVHLESWKFIADGGGGDPPVPPQDGPEEGQIEEGDADISHHFDDAGDRPMAEAEDEVDTGVGEVEEAEAPQQTRAARRGSEPCCQREE